MTKVISTKSGTESQILAVGSYRPKRLVPNSEIVDRIDSSDEWIQQRTGIESRRIASENETVLDFTMGSGTTGVACKNLNRNFIGIELDERYFNIAKERINGN